ncbi:MAG: hypothetical protein ABW034_13370 [Steroidobacteraceae bacterium]
MTGPAAETLPFFLRPNSGFGRIRPEDDLLHPASFAKITDDSATETQYFGFCVPEARLHGLTYVWWHPNLKVCSGGLFVYRGIKPTTVHAELCDWRTYMNDAVITKNDLHDYRLSNGFGVRIVEPLQKFHITYADEANGNHLDLNATAVLPPVMFEDGNHFEQSMRMKGEVTLRGSRYAVDCYAIRDRSWGKPRPETLMPFPPVSWMTASFTDDFSFNCNAFDHASGQPERAGEWVMPDERGLNSGWIFREGTLGRVVKATKRITRAVSSTICSAIDLQLVDEHGRVVHARGTGITSCPIQLWGNVWTVINLIRWDCEGHVGYGDCQDVLFGSYLNSKVFKGER